MCVVTDAKRVLNGCHRIMRMIILSVATATIIAGCGGQAKQAAPTSGPSAAAYEYWAAPYDYLAAGGPPPTQIMKATGIRRFTLAFIVSDGTCTPIWNAPDPLTGGPEEAAIRDIRAAGGDVAVSFGGAGDTKLAATCTSPEALADAYQQVISAYRLHAIDLDAEDTELATAAVRQRMVSALIILRRRDPGLMISITIPAEPDGPDASGRDLIARAAAAGLRVDAWTIMPFDFSAQVPDMGQASVQAAEALKNDLMSAYHEPSSAAYRTMGISSANGRTETGEIVSAADFQTMLRYVQAHHLARFAFWSVNRDRPCTPGSNEDTCSGIAQVPYAFTRIAAEYPG
jgi:chitinase